LTNPDYPDGTEIVLAYDSPSYAYEFGYGYIFERDIPVGTKLTITGFSNNTGVCDVWEVEMSEITGSVFMYEWDLRPAD
jgi:hypothetical protein